MSMHYADTDIVYLAILDITSPEKRRLVERTRTGPLALPLLERMGDRLAVVNRKGKPYAVELGHADTRHDVALVALDLVCRVHEILGALPEFAGLADKSRKVRDTLSMSRGIITASYGQEAANAHRNRNLLGDVADALADMHVAPGLNAFDLAEMFISSGEQIGRLLARRADALAAAQSAKAEASGYNLLQEARDLLIRTRAMMSHEVSLRDDLPADLVDRVFSVLDERLAVAVAGANRGRASAAATVDGAAAEGAEPDLDDGAGRDGTADAAPDLDGGASAEADGVEPADEPAAPAAEPPADAPAAAEPAPSRLNPLPRNG